MNLIIGLAGKKSSGKNSLANFILGWQLFRYGIIQEEFQVSREGLWLSDVEGDKEFAGILDINRQTDLMFQFIDYIKPIISLYSFAQLLKDNIARDLFNLSFEQCYGTEEDKNTLTGVAWDNFPMNVRLKYSKETEREGVEEPKEFGGMEKKSNKKNKPRTGLMTAREFLQIMGTDQMRAIDPDIWVKALMRKIEKEGSELAVITDVRFPNEAKAIEDAGGKVVHLTRSLNSNDTHPSETALSDYSFKYEIDNAHMTFPEQNKAMANYLEEWLIAPTKDETLENNNVTK